jgi:hypothetical protein
MGAPLGDNANTLPAKRILERANIMLAPVATDIMGVSGRVILAALIAERADTGTMHAAFWHRQSPVGLERRGPR